jgi:hypothetical protein
MRPILSSVDLDADPPTMTVCFIGIPHRFVTLRILGNAATREEMALAAGRAFDCFTDSEVELMSEVAKPVPGSYGTSTWRPSD